MAIHHNVSLSSDTIVKVWRSSANARAVADRKFRIIHAVSLCLDVSALFSTGRAESHRMQASDFLYLDCEYPEQLISPKWIPIPLTIV